jgi:hypothetical protein
MPNLEVTRAPSTGVRMNERTVLRPEASYHSTVPSAAAER